MWATCCQLDPVELVNVGCDPFAHRAWYLSRFLSSTASQTKTRTSTPTPVVNASKKNRTQYHKPFAHNLGWGCPSQTSSRVERNKPRYSSSVTLVASAAGRADGRIPHPKFEEVTVQRIEGPPLAAASSTREEEEDDEE